MISGILLAAGSSKRMGNTNKLLLKIDRVSMVKKVIKEYLKSSLSEIIVVTGHQDNLIIKELTGYPITIIYNKNHQSGMTSSIQCGLSILNKQYIGFLIGTADTPGISSLHINSLIKTFRDNLAEKKYIVRSQYESQYTHPTIFPVHYKELLLECKAHEGCRSIIENHGHNVSSVMNNPSVLQDVDTMEDFATWNPINV